jgi:hypothetical protein
MTVTVFRIDGNQRKQNEEQPIPIREPDRTAHLALQNGNLPPERGILRLKPALWLGWRHQQSHQEDEQRDHCRSRYVIPSLDQTDEVFGTHNLPDVAAIDMFVVAGRSANVVDAAVMVAKNRHMRSNMTRLERADQRGESPFTM